MFLFTIKKKRKNQSLLKCYSKIQVSEKNTSAFRSEKILQEVSKKDVFQFLRYFNFPTSQQLIESLSRDQLDELTKKFGGLDEASKQYLEESENLRKTLLYIIHNRIRDINGNEYPLYRVLNKLKHGYQVIDNGKPDYFYGNQSSC